MESLASAGLKAGDEVDDRGRGPDTILVRRVRRDADAALGVFDGLFGPGHLDRLRGEEHA